MAYLSQFSGAQVDAAVQQLLNMSNNPDGVPTSLVGYRYMGLATKSDPSVMQNPTTPCYWLATEVGTYSNLGGVTVAEGDGVVAIMWSGSWQRKALGITSHDELIKLMEEKINILPGKNLYNKDTDLVGYYIAFSDGIISDSSNHRVSDFIKVEPGESYHISADGDLIVDDSNIVGFNFYDENKARLNTVRVSKQITIPSEVHYIRTTIGAFNNYIQVEKGDRRTTYSPYTPIGGYEIAENSVTNPKIAENSVTNKKIADNSIMSRNLTTGSVTIEKVSFAGSENLLNNNDKDFREGYYISDLGVLMPNPVYSTTGYISIEEDKTYYFGDDQIVPRYMRFVVFYDETLTVLFPALLENVTNFTTPEGAKYVRFCFSNDLSNPHLNEGSLKKYTPYQSIIKEEYIPDKPINDNAVTTPKISDRAVTIEKLSFVQSVNLINKDDPDVAIGKYLNSDSSLSPNTTYNTTGYISITPGVTYVFKSLDSYGPGPRFYGIFNSNKEITKHIGNDGTPFTAQEGDAYIRITYYATNWNIAQFSESPAVPYQDYKPQIPGGLVSSTSSSEVIFFLPKHIYVANGRTIELYYNQIILNAELYNIQAVCPVGKALERKFQIVGDASHIGNTYTLTISVFDSDANLLASDTSTIHITTNTISSAKKILPIGDSLTNHKPWLTELTTLSANLSTIGTRGTTSFQHEGRSGGSCSFYNRVDGLASYTFDNNYVGGQKDAPIFDNSKSYSIGDFVRVPIGSGNSSYRVWVFTANHSAGEFQSSEAYCISTGNPFYNWNTSSFSMSFYKSFNGITYDAIIIFLGTNGINLTPETNPDGALGIKTLIENIRNDEPTIPIIVVNTIFRSGQNGIGNQGNTDGYSAQSEYKFNADRKVLLLAKAINDMCGSMSNVYLCPVGATHDSKYNFGNTKVQVNPRLTSTDVVYELNPSDSVHPQNSGYYQMADEIFSTLCAVFNS